MPPKLKNRLISALWEWAEEENRTTYMQVHADHGTRLPPGFVKNNQIILNISSTATHRLQMGEARIGFQARFGGRIFEVEVPAERISAVYIKDSDIGLVFPITDSPTQGDSGSAESPSSQAPQAFKKLNRVDNPVQENGDTGDTLRGNATPSAPPRFTIIPPESK